MSKKKSAMPQKVLVYVCDTDRDTGEPIYAVASNAEDLPDDAGEVVGVYMLNRVAQYRVRRELL